MKAAQSKGTTDDAQLREMIEDYAEGLRNKDADRCVSNYTDDVVQFDLAPPL
jgi:ketosteroid isomerase-like protein